jgi:hypothetical protein
LGCSRKHVPFSQSICSDTVCRAWTLCQALTRMPIIWVVMISVKVTPFRQIPLRGEITTPNIPREFASIKVPSSVPTWNALRNFLISESFRHTINLRHPITKPWRRVGPDKLDRKNFSENCKFAPEIFSTILTSLWAFVRDMQEHTSSPLGYDNRVGKYSWDLFRLIVNQHESLNFINIGWYHDFLNYGSPSLDPSEYFQTANPKRLLTFWLSAESSGVSPGPGRKFQTIRSNLLSESVNGASRGFDIDCKLSTWHITSAEAR